MAAQARLRIVAVNDVYELTNLPKFQTLLSKLSHPADAVVMAGDFLSPSPLSSLDGGRGMVATLRALGLTHAILGNHEADLHLPSLQRRITELSKSAVLVNSNLRKRNVPDWLVSPMAPPYSIVHSKCGRVKVALLGFVSDEEKVFRDGKFRGISISNVLSSFDEVYQAVIPTKLADMVVPMTHQSLKRDKELAQHMLGAGVGSSVIIGGHEHEPYDLTVPDNCQPHEAFVRILKSGTEAEQASVIDLQFDLISDTEPPKLVDIQAEIADVKNHEPSVVVLRIVDSKMSVIKSLENEVIVNADTMLSPGVPLSSERSRFQQTTVGAVLCKAIKDELDNVDVVMINGATIKGGKTYDNDRITYAELKTELPFPTKMVVVPMLRWELMEAIHYSRTHVEDDAVVVDGQEPPRRGYLQVDADYDAMALSGGPLEDKLWVALPRNLLNGFCQIRPLMDLGDQLKAEGKFPGDDDFVPALNLVVRHFCKNLWFEIMKENVTFEELDLNGDGVLDRHEIKVMMEKFLGHEPPDFFVDDVLAAIDEDGNEVIDAGEFSYLLATMEREDVLRKL